MKLRYFALTDVGSVRKRNEDSILEIPEHSLFMVADGMGGEKAGQEASQQVVKTVERVMREFFDAGKAEAPQPIGKMMRDVLNVANKEVFEISLREPDKTGLGSTGSLLFFSHGLYFASQVGDSRIYLIRNGDVKQVTRDHTIVWTLYENGVITRDQLETHPDRHLLTQCVGGPKPIDVDLFEDRVEVNDTFLICSDGLTGYAGEGKVFQILLEPEMTLEERAKRLLKAALDGGGGDNVSIILIQVESLDPEDNWQPDGTAEPKKSAAPSPAGGTPPAGTFVGGSSRKSASIPSGYGSGNRHLVAGAVIILLAIVSFFVAMSLGRPGQKIRLEAAGELKDVEAVVRDSTGAPVPNAITDLDGATLTFNIPKKPGYTLEVSAAGLAATKAPLDFSKATKAPMVLKLGN